MLGSGCSAGVCKVRAFKSRLQRVSGLERYGPFLGPDYTGAVLYIGPNKAI